MSPIGKVFIVEDDGLIVASLSKALKRDGYEIRGAGSAEGVVEKISGWSPDVVLLDVSLPDGSGLEVLAELRSRGVDSEVVMLTADASAVTATKAMKAGAADYVTKPFDLDEVRLVLQKAIESHKLKREVDDLRRSSHKRARRDLVGESPAMSRLKESIEKIAVAGVQTVLITGESGTGKELVARIFHRLRHGDPKVGYSPFVGVNCAALPEHLIESELFGHERGAFTDAKTDKKGVFELAEGGTLLLDEIGDMPMNLQATLLRVLEERTVRRIGGRQDIAVNCDVLATTNTDLARSSKIGRFRLDLFYRLSAFHLSVPPLRERGEDVLELSRYFLGRFSEKYGKRMIKGFTQQCEEALLGYRWPGNVRELRNVVERIVVLESAEWIGTEHLPTEIKLGGAEPDAPGPLLPEKGLSLEEVKRNLIVQALEKTNHNKMAAARLLNISYDTLRYQMKRFGLA